MNSITSVIVFAAGAAVLIYSAEKLITYLVGAARGLAISLFLLAILFTGIEFDDLVFGIALNLEGLENVALGVIFGTVISMSGLVLALAAIIAPNKVEVPKDYIAIFALAPLILIVPALAGELSVLASIVFVLLFVAFVGYVAYRESRRPVPTFRSAEVLERMEEDEVATVTAGGGGSGGTPPASGGAGGNAGDLYDTGELSLSKSNRRPGWQLLLLAVLALIGLVVGAWAMTEGTGGILENFAISGTVFGATIATLVLSLEDIFLTVEPSRKGAPAIGVGNVIGSVVFSVTAKLGIIVLAGGAIVIGTEVFSWHLPALVVILIAALLQAGAELTVGRNYGLALLFITPLALSMTQYAPRLAGDGICLALAEHHVGGLRGVRNGLAMTVSSGIGGGLVVDGRVLRGATGNAGHVGHMVVPGRNDPCGCGGAGCVEAVAGGLASVRWARERGWGGATGAELARAARDGDPVARAVLERAGTALGQALASAAALLDLDSVVVGGGFAESGAPLWEPMRAAVAAHARLDFVRDLRIVPSRLGGDATLLGGGVLATDRFDDPGRPVP